MKEQKELIEAALALVDALEEKGWFECPEEARLTNAAEAYRKAQKEGRRKAPWKDFKGANLYEFDIIEHPDGEKGVILFLDGETLPEDQWRVAYGRGFANRFCLSRLCLQLDDKGQAIKVSP